jgi:hypothetical protein
LPWFDGPASGEVKGCHLRRPVICKGRLGSIPGDVVGEKGET